MVKLSKVEAQNYSAYVDPYKLTVISKAINGPDLPCPTYVRAKRDLQLKSPVQARVRHGPLSLDPSLPAWEMGRAKSTC